MFSINELIKKVGLVFGMHITRVTSSHDLKGLIKKLRPVSTDHELIRVGPRGDGGYLLPMTLKILKHFFPQVLENYLYLKMTVQSLV